MINFERNYRVRRAISQALQQSQKSESQVAERNGQIVIHCKRDLLFLLSKWLLELNSASPISEAERKEIQSLTRVSLGTWVHLQASAVQIAKDLKEAEAKEKEAIALLNKKAPAGWATKMFADLESKTQIKSLQNDVRAAQRHCENTSAKFKQNVEDRRTLGEVFFRDCLKHCDELASTKALGREAGAILSRMSKETNALWVREVKQQAAELDQLAGFIASLRESYKDRSASTPQGNSYEFPER